MANQIAMLWKKTEKLPLKSRLFIFSKGFGAVVKLAGTTGLRFTNIDEHSMTVVIRNKRKNQNHIKGVHAAGMVLVAETATGATFGMSLPGDKLPLVKHMSFDFVRRSEGDITATATLDPADLERMKNDPKGEVDMKVVVTDESGNEPIVGKCVWAWVPKKRG